jgi:uncharacterized protein YceK
VLALCLVFGIHTSGCSAVLAARSVKPLFVTTDKEIVYVFSR